MERKVYCTICPKACLIRVYQDASGKVITEGAQCPKGEKFAAEELCNPKRILTTTVRVRIDEKQMLLPVRTIDFVGKEFLNLCMKELARIVVKREIKIGETIYPNICDSGVDVIASTDTSLISQK